MLKFNGLFDSFDNLDKIDINTLTTWLKSVSSSIQLENYLANKILYPQSVPISDSDMKIDLAILREALRLNGPKVGEKVGSMLGENPFLNITLRKVIIPESFLVYVPDLISLTWAFIDGLLLDRRKEDFFWDLWTVVLADDMDEIVGSIILPQFKNNTDSMDLTLLGKVYKVKAGSLMVVPCAKERCEISYKFTNGKILGKKENAVEISGGKLGLMIDGRSK